MKNDIQQLQQRQRYLQLGIFTLLTVMIWVGFSLLQAEKKTKITPEQKKLAAPLNPTINTQILDELEAKTTYSQEELAQFPIYKLILTANGTEEVVTLDVPDPVITRGGERQSNQTVKPSPQPSTESPTTETLPVNSSESSSTVGEF